MYTNSSHKVVVGVIPVGLPTTHAAGKGKFGEIGTPREGGDGGRLEVCLLSFGVWVVVLEYIGF